MRTRSGFSSREKLTASSPSTASEAGALAVTASVRAANESISEPEDHLADSEVVRYKSFDGTQIPSILYKPHQSDAAHKAPALVFVHGGPGGQTRTGYSPIIQYLVNHGYVVLGVNNRGSSGYGKSFYTADDGKHGHEPLWDCVEAKKYLRRLHGSGRARLQARRVRRRR